MRFLSVIVLILSIAHVWAKANNLKNIAVLPFTASNGVDSTISRQITERIETELLKTGVWRILERSQMDKILIEQGFQQSGACDSEGCQVEMGKLLGVDLLAVGSVSKLGNMYSLNAKLVNVENGAIEQSQSIDAGDDVSELLTKSCHDIAFSLSGKPIEHHFPWLWVGIGSVVIGGVAVLIAVLPGDTKTVTSHETIEP